MKSLAQKVSVVTGGGSGIGRAASLALAGQGSAVAVCDLDEGRARETADSIVKAGGRASIHQVDVASEDRMRALVEEVLTEHGVVDVVVNNAGIAPPMTKAVDISLDQFRKVMDINFWGMVYGSLLFLPHLLSRPEANLVNVSSNAGLVGYSRMTPYSSSKFAIRGFTESLRMELRSSPVKLTVVCPGATHTSIMANSPLMGDQQRQKMQRSFDTSWARPPEAVGDAIVKGILKNRPRCLVGPDTALLDLVARILPGLYSKLLGPGVDMTVNKLLETTDRREPIRRGPRQLS
jgi:NAD(P)-dependent dehydrogenase (short-subunit alcohol dehydrogenase family)